MPSLTTARTANAKLTFKSRPVIVALGGTSGIGRGIVEVLARHAHGNAHIVIVGRNAAAANSIIAGLPPSADSEYEFVPCDAASLAQMRAVLADLCARLPKVNYLVLSSGALEFGAPVRLTPEGFDAVLGPVFLARFLFARELAPLLERAAAAGEDARVLSVLAAGHGGPVDPHNLSFPPFTLWNAPRMRATGTTWTDCILFELSKRHPTVSFLHNYPGFVRTPIGKNFPIVLRVIFFVFALLLSHSATDCGEYLTWALTSPAYAAGGVRSIGERGDPLPDNVHATPLAREKVWAMAENYVNMKPRN